MVAASLAGGMIAQQAGKEPVSAAQAVILWQEVLTELQKKNASG